MWGATLTGQKAAPDMAIEKKFTSLEKQPQLPTQWVTLLAYML